MRNTEISFDFNETASQQVLSFTAGNHRSVVMGRIYQIDETTPERPSEKPIPEVQINGEIKRFKAVLDQYRSLYDAHIAQTENLPIENRKQTRGILIAEKGILDDGGFTKRVCEIIQEGFTADFAVHTFLGKMMDVFKNSEDTLATKADLFKCFRKNLLTLLAGQSITSLQDTPKDSVLMVSAVPPGETTNLFADGSPIIHAMINTEGSKLDHTNIVAGANSILVARIDEDEQQRITNGSMVIVDGHNEKIIVNPSQDNIRAYREVHENLEQKERELLEESQAIKTPQTKDGVDVKVHVNVVFSSEISKIHNDSEDHVNAEGVGLYRTEFAMFEGYSSPGKTDASKKQWAENLEGEWLEYFTEIAKSAKDKPLNIRTVDFYGDKRVKGKKISVEEKQDIVRIQMRAALIVSSEFKESNIRILIPMIRGADEYNFYKDMMVDEACKLGRNPLPLGPVAEVVSFVSRGLKDIDADLITVGSNDLIPSILGYDRYSEDDQELYDPTCRAFLETLQSIAEQQSDECSISICGGIASDPQYLPLIIGAGITEVSVGVSKVPIIKELVHRIDMSEAKELVEQLIRTERREDREALLEQFNTEKLDYHFTKPIEKTPITPRPKI